MCAEMLLKFGAILFSLKLILSNRFAGQITALKFRDETLYFGGLSVVCLNSPNTF